MVLCIFVYVFLASNTQLLFVINEMIGVTTIAGGSSQKAGRTDGPARNASFSDDFELTFVPGRCALMISDHGNRLIRQINLKAENCKVHSGSGKKLFISRRVLLLLIS